MTTAASQTSGALGSGSSYMRKHYPGTTQNNAVDTSATANGMTLSYNVGMDTYELRNANGDLVWQTTAHQLANGAPASLTTNGLSYSYYSQLAAGGAGSSGSGSGGGYTYVQSLGGSGGAGGAGMIYHGGNIFASNCGTSLKSEGIRAGEIIAWRAWRVSGVHLRSAVMDSVWSEHEPMKGDPIKDYGVHAYNHKNGPYHDGYAGPGTMIAFCDGWVTGQVALWGEIVEHKHGYRAQYARVHSLDEWYEYIAEHQRQALIKKYVRKPNGQQAVE